MRDGDDERSVRGADHAACGGDARCNVYQYAVGVLDEGAGVPGVEGACRTVQAVRSAIAAAPALPQVPRPMRADDVLPERALLGDQDAVDELVNTVYASLQTAGPDDPTLETVSTFLRNGGSLETTAKELSVHPNTVRYRLKRAAETTGWDAADAREAYVLRTAIALGRMHTA